MWKAFQKQESSEQVEKLYKETYRILTNLDDLNQGEYASIIRKFSSLKSKEQIRDYLERMLLFLKMTKSVVVANYHRKWLLRFLHLRTLPAQKMESSMGL